MSVASVWVHECTEVPNHLLVVDTLLALRGPPVRAEEWLQYDPAVPSDRFEVRAEGGIVFLIGAVDDLRAKQRAVRIAETVKGGRSIARAFVQSTRARGARADGPARRTEGPPGRLHVRGPRARR